MEYNRVSIQFRRPLEVQMHIHRYTLLHPHKHITDLKRIISFHNHRTLLLLFIPLQSDRYTVNVNDRTDCEKITSPIFHFFPTTTPYNANIFCWRLQQCLNRTTTSHPSIALALFSPLIIFVELSSPLWWVCYNSMTSTTHSRWLGWSCFHCWVTWVILDYSDSNNSFITHESLLIFLIWTKSSQNDSLINNYIWAWLTTLHNSLTSERSREKVSKIGFTHWCFFESFWEIFYTVSKSRLRRPNILKSPPSL